jgi:peptidyl-prolyl cis-trans isomerase C
MNTQITRLGVAFVVTAFLSVVAPLAAQEGSDKVVARVNGHDITVKEVELASDDLRSQLEQVPANLRFAFVVEYLVERHLLAQEAVRSEIANTDEYKERLRFYQAKALRDAYFAKELAPQVTEEKVRQTYEQEAAKVTNEKRARARHILVGTEEEAQAALERVKKGEAFAEVARQISLDGSRDYGGDLGFFTAAEMVPEFSQAVFALQPGELS